MTPDCPYNYDCESTDNCMNECMGYSIEDEERMTLSDIIYDIEEVLNHERSWWSEQEKDLCIGCKYFEPSWKLLKDALPFLKRLEKEYDK